MGFVVFNFAIFLFVYSRECLDSKIQKIWFSILRQKIRRPIKYSASNGIVFQLMKKAAFLGDFNTVTFVTVVQQKWLGSTAHPSEYFVLFIFGLLKVTLMVVLVDDILSHVIIIHIHTHVQINILTHTHTSSCMRFCHHYTTVVICWYLVTTSPNNKISTFY